MSFVSKRLCTVFMNISVENLPPVVRFPCSVGQTVVGPLLDAEAATLSKDYSVDVHPVFDFAALLDGCCESGRRI